jgi:endonuclease/exonuclease/phosphatase family metal-dependent hydrolase
MAINPATANIIMGDFNDGPEDESFKNVLNAMPLSDVYENTSLYNLTLAPQDDWKHGTLKYRENWDIFDQVVVSGALLNGASALKIHLDRAEIFHADFLLEEDERYLGIKPFRTFTGFKYNGGFSDHLPVFIDLFFND